MKQQTGPLAGIRVVEFTGIGPGPHCAMLLSDLGADVLRIDRDGGNGWPNPLMDRGRSAVTVDIRTEPGREYALAALDKADILIEGFRPGVMERIGLGPDVVLARNPRLIYGRVTGWGQAGPRSQTAGHDINYIATAGMLAAVGRPGSPAVPPLNLIGDFGGGSLYLALGILSALLERQHSGLGQVVDAAIVDGVTSLMVMFSGLVQKGLISLDREDNILGGAAPFYRCYLCADGREMAVGALEPHFYKQFLSLIGAPARLLDEQHDKAKWSEHADILAEIFASHSSEHWDAVFQNSDACCTRLLTLEEVAADPHMAARQAYFRDGDVLHSAPAPRFSRTPANLSVRPSAEDLLRQWGVEYHSPPPTAEPSPDSP